MGPSAADINYRNSTHTSKEKQLAWMSLRPSAMRMVNLHVCQSRSCRRRGRLLDIGISFFTSTSPKPASQAPARHYHNSACLAGQGTPLSMQKYLSCYAFKMRRSHIMLTRCPTQIQISSICQMVTHVGRSPNNGVTDNLPGLVDSWGSRRIDTG